LLSIVSLFFATTCGTFAISQSVHVFTVQLAKFTDIPAGVGPLAA
jgi:hypothetical protein